jgi:DNA recombination protein RmuC
MNFYQPLIAIAIGLVFGAAALWLLLRAKTAAAVAEAKAEFQTSLATLAERVSAKEQQLVNLQSALTAEEDQKSQLSMQLQQESNAKAAAEEKCSRIPQLQECLREREERIATLQAELTELKTVRSELQTTLDKERKSAEEKMELLSEAESKLTNAFNALAAQALRNNNQSFLELAKQNLEKFQQAAKGELDQKQQAIAQLVQPVKETLSKLDTQVAQLEEKRVGAYKELSAQVRTLTETHSELRTETGNLVKALRAPQVRGRWGEIQLKRVVELAGMLEYCDFSEQASVSTEDGRLRPDLLVRLPAGKNIVVDAKTPLSAYLEAVEAPDDATRLAKLAEHAAQVRTHMVALGRKSYWDQFKPTPEFVVMFMPGETFFSAALEHDPTLIEQGVEQRVILATPTTLIALLKAVAYGWRQEKIAENAQAISNVGRELYKRIADMTEHFENVGSSLVAAVRSYNKTLGTLESRVLVSARRFHELETTGTEGEIPSLAPVEATPREIKTLEMPLFPEEQAPRKGTDGKADSLAKGLQNGH